MNIQDLVYGVVTGPAGSGKTHLLREHIKEFQNYGLLTATTGVAARVLGADVPTVNAAVGFFDLASLQRAHDDGTLLANVKEIKKEYDRLVIDEASMMDADVLTLLAGACAKAGLGIILAGDWLQLPPITPGNQRPNWAFRSPMWSLFANNILRLDTQYRQKNKQFLKGLNALRVGDGKTALPLLKKAGVKMSSIPSGYEEPFKGISIVSTNGNHSTRVNLVILAI